MCMTWIQHATQHKNEDMTNLTAQLFIDLDNPVPLDKLEWISKEKVYPTLDPSQELIVYYNSHLEIVMPMVWPGAMGCLGRSLGELMIGCLSTYWVRSW